MTVSEQCVCVDRSRIALELPTPAGGALPVEFRLRPETVEVWIDFHRKAAFDRDTLAAWLVSPRRPLTTDGAADEMAWVVDPSLRVAFALPSVTTWTLPPVVEQQLRERV
jgi:hypothetical protein